MTASPAAHDSHAARSRRTANRSGPPSRPTWGVDESRAGTTPAPTSRRPASTTVAAADPAISAASGRSGTSDGPVSGWRCCTHPSGVVHCTQCRPGPLLPTTRNRKAAPNTAAASWEACRRVGATWLASAPTARKMAGGPIRANARKRLPVGSN